jgi:hypothetical protein
LKIEPVNSENGIQPAASGPACEIPCLRSSIKKDQRIRKHTSICACPHAAIHPDSIHEVNVWHHPPLSFIRPTRIIHKIFSSMKPE